MALVDAMRGDERRKLLERDGQRVDQGTVSNCGAVQQNVVMKLDKSGNSGSPNIAPIINSKSKCNQPRVFLHAPLGCIVHPHKRSCFSSVCTTRSILQDVSVMPQKSSDTAWSILTPTPNCCVRSRSSGGLLVF